MSMKILFALPGLHRFDRGAEIAFMSVAEELAKSGNQVTLIGSGPRRDDVPYRYLSAPAIARTHFEKFPSIPCLRNEYAYEEFTFAPGLLALYRPTNYDVTLTCSYPFTNWMLRRPTLGGKRPPHIFVTQNGDWPAHTRQAEYRYFGCEGLVCTNPDYYERNKARWNCCVIPNGVDVQRFQPGPSHRHAFGLSPDKLIVLMVSALITSKRVDVGIEAVSRIPDAHLVVAGDGPLRQELSEKAASLLPKRFTQMSVPATQMPDLYRCADVFLHLSFEEAFGNVFIEALASGLPVVGHDTERLRWIVGEEGFLLDTRNPDEIARTIVVAATAATNHEPRVARAAKFSWTSVGRMYQAFLKSVVASSQVSTNFHREPRSC